LRVRLAGKSGWIKQEHLASHIGIPPPNPNQWGIRNSATDQYASAATPAAAGIVITQA
jgi:hypothetical protein